MLFHEKYRSIFARKKFWTDYFWITEDSEQYPEFENGKVMFPVSDNFELVLGIQKQMMEISIFLACESADGLMQLGWDDQAHFHPYVFRWDELDIICASISKRTGLDHPGLPLLLLYRFAPITSTDDRDSITEIITGAWRRTNLFMDQEIQQLVDGVDQSNQDLHWIKDPSLGWTLSGDDAYSLRNTRNPDFPFSLIETMVEEAKNHLSSG